MKDNFLVKTEWAEQVGMLTDEQAGQLLKSWFLYHSGDAPEFEDPIVSLVFSFCRKYFDDNANRYAARVSANKENGKSGGRPKKPDGFTENPKNPVGYLGSSKKPKKAESESESESESDVYEGGAGRNAAPAQEPVITLPLNDGTEYLVSQEQCHEWAGLYPAVDVIQQLRNMRGWLISNPDRKKTRRGILRFVTNWLIEKQDKGLPRKTGQPPEKSGQIEKQSWADLARELARGDTS